MGIILCMSSTVIFLVHSLYPLSILHSRVSGLADCCVIYLFILSFVHLFSFIFWLKKFVKMLTNISTFTLITDFSGKGKKVLL